MYIERITAARSICLASLGRCSLIITPGADVAIALNGPPLACPGLGSKVSSWLGPPGIHSRMHDRLRSGCRRVSAANASIHPEAEQNDTPAAIRNQSRRVHMAMLQGRARAQ